MKTRKVLTTKLGRTGFSRVDLLAVVMMCLLLGGPLWVSGMSRNASGAKRIGCVNHLKELGLGFKTWAFDHGDKFPMSVLSRKADEPEVIEAYRYFQVMSNDLASPRVLICPADTRYPAENFYNGLSNSNLSYFVGIDAVDTNPEMFLMGDGNLTNGPLPANRTLVINTNLPIGWSGAMHGRQGNIGLADGSVQQYSASRLIQATSGGSGTNRLVFP